MNYEQTYNLIDKLTKMGFSEELIYNDLLLLGVSEENANFRMTEYLTEN